MQLTRLKAGHAWGQEGGDQEFDLEAEKERTRKKTNRGLSWKSKKHIQEGDCLDHAAQDRPSVPWAAPLYLLNPGS